MSASPDELANLLHAQHVENGELAGLTELLTNPLGGFEEPLIDSPCA